MPRNAPAVLVTMDILEQLQLRSGEPVGVSELARTIGATKATCFTVLRMLLSRGYVTQEPVNRKYSAGPALLALGIALGRGLDAMDLAKRHLVPLCHELGTGGALSRHVGDGAIQLLWLETSLPPVATVPT